MAENWFEKIKNLESREWRVEIGEGRKEKRGW
jgi:hypothetical protein